MVVELWDDRGSVALPLFEDDVLMLALLMHDTLSLWFAGVLFESTLVS